MSSQKDLFESIRDHLAKNTDFKTMRKELWENYGDRCATLVLDCCKFTRITQEAGIVHYLVSLIRLNDIIQPVFEKHGCLSFRTEADNIYAEFKTVDQAFLASVDANQAVAAEKLKLSDNEPFQICIGIGYGDVLWSQNDGVFGDEMNLASKLGEDIACGEEILLTEAAYVHISDKYKKGFEYRDMFISSVPISYYFLNVNTEI